MSRNRKRRPEKAAIAEALPRSPSRGWIGHAVAMAGLAIVTLLLYRSVTDLGWFEYDDQSYVVRNPMLQELSAENLGRMMTEIYFTFWSPLHLLSYALDRAVSGGLEPAAFHLSSALWGAACSALVYLLGFTLLKRRWAAIGAGLLFAVHPAHVEAVAWVSSRKDLVSTAFALLCVIAWAHYREGGRRSWWWYGAAIVACLLAMAAKQSVVILPGIVFLLDWFVERRRGLGLVWDKLPLIAVSVPFVALSLRGQAATGHEFSLLTAGESLTGYFWLLTGFGEYVVFRPRPDTPEGVLASLAVLIVPTLVVALPLVFRRRLPALALVSVGWIVLGLLPAQAASFVHTLIDRYLFFPSVGLCLLLGLGIERAETHWGSKGLAVAAVLIAGLAGFWSLRTASYLEEWHHPLSVWSAAAEKSTDFNVSFQLGSKLEEAASVLATAPRQGKDRRPERARLTELARELWRDDPRLSDLLAEWNADNSRGPQSLAFQKELRDRSKAQLDLAVERKGSTVVPNLFFRRGKLALDRGLLDEAESEFESCREEAARHTAPFVRQELEVRGLHALGLVSWRRRDFPAAMQRLEEARTRQVESGRTFVPELPGQIRRLRGLMKR